MGAFRLAGPIDSRGNIILHGAGGVRITLGPTDGVTMQPRRWLFQTDSGLQITPVKTRGSDLSIDLVITQADVEALPANGARFAFSDITADPPIVRWDGFITRRGFAP